MIRAVATRLFRQAGEPLDILAPTIGAERIAEIADPVWPKN
ncbi:MAG: hypothetical protein WCK95_24780 [Alphaproteobacteria bacterium]